MDKNWLSYQNRNSDWSVPGPGRPKSPIQILHTSTCNRDPTNRQPIGDWPITSLYDFMVEPPVHYRSGQVRLSGNGPFSPNGPSSPGRVHISLIASKKATRKNFFCRLADSAQKKVISRFEIKIWICQIDKKCEKRKNEERTLLAGLSHF